MQVSPRTEIRLKLSNKNETEGIRGYIFWQYCQIIHMKLKPSAHLIKHTTQVMYMSYILKIYKLAFFSNRIIGIGNTAMLRKNSIQSETKM
jgi:hypothetical protein